MHSGKMSYSKIMSFLECPGRYKLRYIDNAPCEERESRGRIVHKYIEGILSDKLCIDTDSTAGMIAFELVNFLDSDVEEHYIERRIDFSFGGEEWIAKPDLILKRSDGVYDVVDFKSTGLSEKNALQGAVYFYAVTSELGSCRSVKFISPNKTKTYTYTVETVEKYLLGIMRAIRGATQFEFRPGAYCNYCSYNVSCPVFNSNDTVGEYMRLNKRVLELRNQFKDIMSEKGYIQSATGKYIYRNGSIYPTTAVYDAFVSEGLLTKGECS